MSSGTLLPAAAGSSDLRERKVLNDIPPLDLNGVAAAKADDESKEENATWGRTPDGTGIFQKSDKLF